MADTPPNQFPTVRESTTVGVRLTVGQWCAVIGSAVSALLVIILAALWLHTVYLNQVSQGKALEAQAKLIEAQGETLKRIENSVQALEFRARYGITGPLTSVPALAPSAIP